MCYHDMLPCDKCGERDDLRICDDCDKMFCEECFNPETNLCLECEKSENVTVVNLEALVILAEFVDALPDDYKQFDMSKFCCVPGYPGSNLIAEPSEYLDLDPCESQQSLENDCNTCGCFLGHGPVAGLRPLADEDWGQYCFRVFDIKPGSPEWHSFFSVRWPNNTKAAAKRVFDYRDNGKLYDPRDGTELITVTESR